MNNERPEVPNILKYSRLALNIKNVVDIMVASYYAYWLYSLFNRVELGFIIQMLFVADIAIYLIDCLFSYFLLRLVLQIHELPDKTKICAQMNWKLHDLAYLTKFLRYISLFVALSSANEVSKEENHYVFTVMVFQCAFDFFLMLLLVPYDQCRCIPCNRRQSEDRTPYRIQPQNNLNRLNQQLEGMRDVQHRPTAIHERNLKCINSMEDSETRRRLTEGLRCKICVDGQNLYSCPECFNSLCKDCYGKLPTKYNGKACPYCQTASATYELIVLGRM